MTETSEHKPALIDIGINLANKRFSTDCAAVLESARRVGVTACMVTGTSLGASREAIALCRQFATDFPGMLYATAGVHPHEASSWSQGTAKQLHQLIAENSDVVVAVGETGLDFNRNFSTPAQQIEAFQGQLGLAATVGLPLFLHERDAHATQLDILKAAGSSLPAAVIHCFTGDEASLHNYLDLGLYVGITGWICDERRGLELQQLVADIPLDRLLVETDAPYLLPRSLKPKPKNNRNEPAHLTEIVATIARCRGQSYSEIATATCENAARLFNLRDL
ncbi:MAG: TatD family hydrolase [Porticoccaceae bacterium]|nr:TatD family hydrolase [Porticoccaceae bacterium]